MKNQQILFGCLEQFAFAIITLATFQWAVQRNIDCSEKRGAVGVRNEAKRLQENQGVLGTGSFKGKV